MYACALCSYFLFFLQGSVEKGSFFRNLDPHYTSAFQVFQWVSYAGFNFLLWCLNAFFVGKTRGGLAIAICANVFFVSSSNFCNILQNPTDCTSTTRSRVKQSSTNSSPLSNKSHNFFHYYSTLVLLGTCIIFLFSMHARSDQH